MAKSQSIGVVPAQNDGRGVKEGREVPVLTAEDRKFWEENGYVVVHNAVPPENLKAAERAVWDFLEMQPDDPTVGIPTRLAPPS